MNKINTTPIRQMTVKGIQGLLQRKLSVLKSSVSKMKTIAAEKKKIVILSQSGDFTNAPL